MSLNRNKNKYIVLIGLSIFVVLLYFLYIRDWSKPITVDVSPMKNITYFNDKKATDYKTVLSAIHRQSRSEDISAEFYDEMKEYYYSNQEYSYNRAAWLSFHGQPHLKLSYSFEKTSESDPTYNSLFVKIFPSPSYKFNYFTGPKLRLSYWESTYIDDFSLQYELRDSYGRFRPIFNIMSKHGKDEDFKYYVSPLIFNKDEYGYFLDDLESATAFMIFVYDEYGMIINFPVLEPSSNIDIVAPIILKDIERLMKQTEEATQAGARE